MVWWWCLAFIILVHRFVFISGTSSMRPFPIESIEHEACQCRAARHHPRPVRRGKNHFNESRLSRESAVFDCIYLFGSIGVYAEFTCSSSHFTTRVWEKKGERVSQWPGLQLKYLDALRCTIRKTQLSNARTCDTLQHQSITSAGMHASINRSIAKASISTLQAWPYLCEHKRFSHPLHFVNIYGDYNARAKTNGEPYV